MTHKATEGIYHFCRSCGNRFEDRDSGRVDGKHKCDQCGTDMTTTDVRWLIEGTRRFKREEAERTQESTESTPPVLPAMPQEDRHD